MADADNVLKLLIELGVVGQDDATRLKQTLDQTGETTKTLGTKTEETGKQAEEANVHHDQSRRIFGEINKVVPGLGEALHAVFAGPLGAIILFGIALEKAKDALKEYNDNLDKEGAEAYQPHLEAMEALASAWDTAIQKHAEYLAAMADAGTEKDPIAKQIKLLKELDKVKYGGADPDIDRKLQFTELDMAQKDLKAAQKAQPLAENEAYDANKNLKLLQAEQKSLPAYAALLRQKIAEGETTLDNDESMHGRTLFLTPEGRKITTDEDKSYLAAIAEQLKKAENRISQLESFGGLVQQATEAKTDADAKLVNASNRTKIDQGHIIKLAGPDGDIHSSEAIANATARAKTMQQYNDTMIPALNETLGQLMDQTRMSHDSITTVLGALADKHADLNNVVKGILNRIQMSGQ